MFTKIHHVRSAALISFLFSILCLTSLLAKAPALCKNLGREVAAESPQEDGIKFKATSAVDRFGKASVVLYWSRVEGVAGYNLYCNDAQNLSLSRRQYVSPVTTCEELKAIVPEGSPEWEMLKKAFPPHPCTALQLFNVNETVKIFDMLAAVNLKIRLAWGLGFIDHDVKANQQYTYELRGVRPDGKEVVVTKEVVDIRAGEFRSLDSPSGFTVIAGDCKVLATWHPNPDAISYTVRRSESPEGPYQIINEKPIFIEINQDLEGNDIEPRPGFVDYQRWNVNGFPDTHEVKGVLILGPKNGVTYYYQVASCDILGRVGSWSSYQFATSMDKTPPMVPGDFKVDSLPDGLVLSWIKVIRDISGHQELDYTQTYKIYRSDSLDSLENKGALSSYLVHSLVANPQDRGKMNLAWKDEDLEKIKPDYGEKDFFYRIKCEDAHGNISFPSVAISGRIPDTMPPGPTNVTGADGYAEYITVRWDPNTEPDLAGYQVYRSTCHEGKPYPEDKCDFMLIEEISVQDAKDRFNSTGNIYYDDHSVPEGSPVCYAYWIRAFDMTGNLYQGTASVCPDEHDEYSEYICQRLREDTPPPAPIISALKARKNSILVEWISSPVQDLGAFHVYRSKKENEPPEFIACVLLNNDIRPNRWEGEDRPCEYIPARLNLESIIQSFTDDKNVEPNQVYWYRVSALDWLGNESEKDDITKIPAISTFTYSKNPDPPNDVEVSLSPTVSTTGGCDLIVRWQPMFDATKIKGFLVFRSTSEIGPYRQVSGIVEKNEFIDKSAVKGMSYWYRVQTMDIFGKLSEPSEPVRYIYQ